MKIETLREELKKGKLDAFWCTNTTNRRYLSGFTGSTGVLYIDASACKLFTDFRYTQQAMRQAKGFEVIECAAGELDARVAEACMHASVRRFGFEEDDVTVVRFEAMRESLSGRTELIYAGHIPTALRAVKTPDETENIRNAARVADQVFLHISGFVKEGMSERDVAVEIDYQIKKRSDATSFDTIAASGPNSALPHAQPGGRRLRRGDALVLDFGAVCGGYCSDITRTIFVGAIDKELHRVYNIVRYAQETALQGIRAGMRCGDADGLARRIIEEAGYGKEFGHSLGHGVGLEVHEAPRVSGNASEVLREGMVITVEPGIYIPKLGGVRIEDMCVVRKDGLENLYTASKDVVEV